MPSFTGPEPLHIEHALSAFTCGKPSLDAFLKLHALDKQRAMLSRTYVVTCDGTVIAYYTLAHIAIVREQAPKKLGHGMPSEIPAMLLARLAIDNRYQHQGLGRSLFRDAMIRTWGVMLSGPAPVRLFVVDAIDEGAKVFYEQFGMRSAPDNPMRLFLHYKDLRSVLGNTVSP